MKIKKYKPLIITLVLVAILALILSLGRLTNKPEMILFFGDTCPHCKNVENYIQTNNVKSKLNFQELEVFNNADNASLLGEKAKQCGLDTSNGVGVPFFFDGKNCIQGDEPIIEFFKTK
jgi:glutaredoxin